MAGQIIDQLFEEVVRACDSLYTQHQLITTKAVSDLVAAEGRWTAEELAQAVPGYISTWRIQNMESTSTASDANQIIGKTRSQIIAELRAMLAKMGRGDV